MQDLWLNNSEAGGKEGKKGRRRRRRRPRPILRGVFFPLPGERERVKRRGEERPNPSSSVGFLFISQTPLLLPPLHFFLPRTLRALMEVREGPIPPPGGKKGEMKIETFTCSEEKRGKTNAWTFSKTRLFFCRFLFSSGMAAGASGVKRTDDCLRRGSDLWWENEQARPTEGGASQWITCRLWST